jgi:hypothetical protein
MLLCVAIILIAHSGSYVSKSYAQHSQASYHQLQIQAKQGDAVSASPTSTLSTSTSSTQGIQITAQANLMASCDALGLDGADASSGPSIVHSTPCPSPDYVSYSDDFNFVSINSSRFISLAQHDVSEVRPIYLLAFEFTAELAPTLAEPSNIDISHDWTLTAVSSPARISGWKASNLQYRFSQQAA